MSKLASRRHREPVYIVCPDCRGKGSRVNPAIDGHGISRDEFEEDPEFLEAYLRGDYDVPCPRCGGLRVVDRREELLKELRECLNGYGRSTCTYSGCDKRAVMHWETRTPEYPGAYAWPEDHFRCIEHCGDHYREELKEHDLLEELPALFAEWEANAGDDA